MKKIYISLILLSIAILGYVFFMNQNKNTGFTQIIETSGITKNVSYGGVSWGDYNNDKYQDLLVKARGRHILYRNNQDETFTDVTDQVGLTKLGGQTTSAVFGDYDNDGCLDLYVMNGFSESGLSDTLYQNNCNGMFTDVSDGSGLDAIHNARGVSWGDYDNDGYLDLYVSTWGKLHFIKTETSWTVDGWDYQSNVLYQNNRDGTFTNVTEEAGVGGLTLCEGRNEGTMKWDGIKNNWQPVWFDYDNDGFQDLYVSNETTMNTLYHNNGDGTFTNVTEEAGLCYPNLNYSTHGVAVGDYDNNGFLDIYVGGSKRSLLWQNNGNGTFSEVSEQTGTASIGFLTWGVGAFDYNNDGHLDIYAINGSTGNASYKNDYPNRLDMLYENNGQGQFVDVAEEQGLYGNDVKTFGAFADFNNDGFVDAFVASDNNNDGIDYPSMQNKNIIPSRLYKNIPNDNHWLTIALVGTKSNKSGIGAMITAETEGGTQIRQVIAGDTLVGQNGLWPTFGLGTSKVATVTVRWPSGLVQRLDDIEVNQILTITESD